MKVLLKVIGTFLIVNLILIVIAASIDKFTSHGNIIFSLKEGGSVFIGIFSTLLTYFISKISGYKRD